MSHDRHRPDNCAVVSADRGVSRISGRRIRSAHSDISAATDHSVPAMWPIVRASTRVSDLERS